MRNIRDTRTSDNVSDRKGEDVNDAGISASPFVGVVVAVFDFEYT